jgi:hypothetical protein
MSCVQDAPVTTYYLWLPFLLTLCFLFAKVSHNIWKIWLEDGTMKNLLQYDNRQLPQASKNILQVYICFSD